MKQISLFLSATSQRVRQGLHHASAPFLHFLCWFEWVLSGLIVLDFGRRPYLRLVGPPRERFFPSPGQGKRQPRRSSPNPGFGTEGGRGMTLLKVGEVPRPDFAQWAEHETHTRNWEELSHA